MLIARQASRCQQAFSKPCLVNLISKDTHLVFSMYIIEQVPRGVANVSDVSFAVAVVHCDSHDISRRKLGNIRETLE